MKIVHIITGLGDGGAEHTLFKICKYDKLNKHVVISFRKGGKYLKLLNNLAVKVHVLDANFFSLNKFFILVNLLRSLKPDIVQTWLVHADFIGGIASKIAGINNVIWNIRYSNIDIDKSKFITNFILIILSKLSFLIPKSIIINSKIAKKIYTNKGYDNSKLKYIPNGYDLTILKINNDHKKYLKNKYKIKKQIPLLGYVARYDLLKDHLNLLKALYLIKIKGKKFICFLVGTNINKNKILIEQIKKFNLINHVKLLGPMENISIIMNSLDIHVQSSKSEGFPNVIAEAMAHKTPCVATSVGDTSYIMGKSGWLVKPKNSTNLAIALERALDEIRGNNWNKRCNMARTRIKKKFSIKKMINSYNQIWLKVYKKNKVD